MLIADFNDACPESLFAHALWQKVPPYSLDAQESAIRSYMRKRGRPSGLRFPRVFESAIALELAERYRLAGMMDRCRSTVVLAADDFPEHLELRALAARITDDIPLDWPSIILPRRASPNDSPNDGIVPTAAAMVEKIPVRRVKPSVRAPKKRSVLRR